MIGLSLILIVIIFGVIIFKGWTRQEHRKRFKTYDEIREALKEEKYNTVDQFGRSLLMQALKNDFDELIERILEETKELNQADEKGETAIFYAVRYESLKCLKKLIDKDIDINHKNIDGVTALWYAAKKSNPNYAMALIDAGISLNDQDQSTFFSPIMIAIKNRNFSTMKVILEAGADLTLESSEGNVLTLLENYVMPHLTDYGKKAYKNQEIIRQIETKVRDEVLKI